MHMLAGDHGLYPHDNPYVYHPVPWLALADTAWHVGRLDDFLREQALIAIDRDLELWRDSEHFAQRDRALRKLRRRLNAPQPPAKGVRKRYRQETEFGVNDVFSYRLQSGRFALLHVVDHNVDAGGLTPVIAVLDWEGERIPPLSESRHLPARGARRGPGRWLWGQFSLARRTRADYPGGRIAVVARNASMTVSTSLGVHDYVWWKDLDQHLREAFGLE